MSDSTTKRCPKCKEPHPASTEYFYKDKTRKDGLACWCITCTSMQAKVRYKKNPEKAIKRAQKYAQDNPEKVLEKVARWQQENPERTRENKRKSYIKNREKNRDRVKENKLRWKKQNPERTREHVRRRRTAKRMLPNCFTSVDEKRMLEYWDNCCAVCGKPVDLFTQLDADHWIPLSDTREDNPGTVPTNIVPLCRNKHGITASTGCNGSKANKKAEIWLVETFGKRKADQVMRRVQAYFEWVKNNF